jgi:Domain of unknown function (DUF4279)
VRIRQYAYFAIYSDRLTPSDITGSLGVEPDAFRVRGSKTTEPPVPRHHSWRIDSTLPGLTVEAHLQAIVDRLNPYAEAIGSLVGEIESAESLSGVGGILGVVRHFDDDEGEDEDLSVAGQPGDPRLEKLPGQHQLLGWRLGASVISFLMATRSALDIDEYG